jgi:hypothetical protein
MLDTVSASWDICRLLSEADISLVTTGKIMTMEELSNVQGRAWEDVDVSGHTDTMLNTLY